jgi:thiamine monophosphate synthase
VPVIGLSGLRAVAGVSPVPVVAIGGISADNAPGCLAAGAAGVAVIGALFGGSPDLDEVEDRSRRLRAAVAAAERRRR